MCSDQIPPKNNFACGGIISPRDFSHPIYITHRKEVIKEIGINRIDLLFTMKVYHFTSNGIETEERLCLKNSNQN